MHLLNESNKLKTLYSKLTSFLPMDDTVLLEVDLNELAEATRVVIVHRLRIAERLSENMKRKRGLVLKTSTYSIHDRNNVEMFDYGI